MRGFRFQVVPAWYVVVPHNYGIGNRLLNRRDDKKKSVHVMGYELLVLISLLPFHGNRRRQWQSSVRFSLQRVLFLRLHVLWNDTRAMVVDRSGWSKEWAKSAANIDRGSVARHTLITYPLPGQYREEVMGSAASWPMRPPPMVLSVDLIRHFGGIWPGVARIVLLLTCKLTYILSASLIYPPPTPNRERKGCYRPCWTPRR